MNVTRHIGFLAAALLSAVAFAQDPPATPPSPPALPSLTQVAAPLGMATPNCAGANIRSNTPDFYEGITAAGAKVTVAWCQQVDGGYAGWIRQRPVGDSSVNAPVVWLTDTAPRGTPVTPIQQYAVAPGTAADKTRPSYSVKQVDTGLALGKADGGRAVAGIACACDMIAVKAGSATYCSFAPTPTAASVALCKPVTGAAASTASHMMLNMARDPMMAPETKTRQVDPSSASLFKASPADIAAAKPIPAAKK